jgi:Ca2+-binding RTX toxin-like protein
VPEIGHGFGESTGLRLTKMSDRGKPGGTCRAGDSNHLPECAMPLIFPLPTGSFFQTITGTSGNDERRGSRLDDLMYGGDGNDVLSGLRGDDYLDGGAGNDILQGGAGNDTMIGSDGNDTINSGTGDDLIFGGAGDDSITANLDDTTLATLYGGDGRDLFELVNAAPGFQVKIADFVFGTDTLTINGLGFDAVVASGVALTALPDGGVSVTLPALGGTLVLTGTSVQDLLGSLSLSGADTFSGAAQDDYFDGGAGDDVIGGGDGRDVLGGGDGNDRIDGGAGNDTIGGDRGNDTLSGGDGADAIYGRFGNNLIDGGAGDDLLSSGRDSSTVIGGLGDDTLSARQEAGGDHVLTGGAGADSFEFFGARSGRQSDSVITDFELGVDRFSINGVDGFAVAADLGFADGPEGAVLVLATGSTITFAGVDAADLNAILADYGMV